MFFRTDVETIMEHFGHVSPLLSPIRPFSPFLMEPCTSISPSTKNNKAESLNTLADTKKSTNRNRISTLDCNNIRAEIVSNEIQRVSKNTQSSIVFSKPSCSFNSSDNLNKDFACQMKLNSSLSELFALKAKERLKRQPKKRYEKMDSIDDDLSKFFVNIYFFLLMSYCSLSKISKN